MDKNKSIILITVLFIIFSFVFTFNKSAYDVINVVSPTEVIIDKNKNGEADDGETIKLLNGYQVITKYEESDNIASDLGLDEYTRYALAYLSEKYANDFLLDKKVELDKVGENDEIILRGEKYSDLFAKSGYLFKNGKPVNPEMYKIRLEKIKKSDYRLYNVKSNKYHLLTCEYGQKSHLYTMVSKSQLPKGALPCKYCIDNDVKTKTSVKNKKSSDIKSPSLVYSIGCIKIFFTDYTRNLTPNRHGNSEICKELVSLIDQAKSTIDIAIYGYDRVPKIESALKRAISRGVVVRLVYDIDSKGENIYQNTKEFAGFINNSKSDKAPMGMQNSSQYTNYIMHDKFYIFDNSVVMTGSANLSHTDMSSYNSNCVVLIKSKKIAQVYTDEFNQMYNGKFHNLKSKLDNKTNILLGNTYLSVYFSPNDRAISNVIIPIINRAKNYIYMPVFLITDNNLANALVSAKQRGVDVRVIVDATNARISHSKHNLLRQKGILVKTENYAGKLHSKSIIVDDYYSIIGSMNFSKSGENKNDENVLVLKDSKIAKIYKIFFNYLWDRISNYWLTHDVSAESVYSIGSCSDGIDNDYDGKTDLEDEGCKIHNK